MTFTEAVAAFFRNTFDYRGRAGRREYWYPWLLMLLLNIIFALSDRGIIRLAEITYSSGLLGFAAWAEKYLSACYRFITFWPFLSVSVRRLHDSSRSGKVLLYIWMIPTTAAIILLFLIPRISFRLYYRYNRLFMMIIMGLVVIAYIVYTIFMCVRGIEGDNKYGPSPLAGNAKDERSGVAGPAKKVFLCSAAVFCMGCLGLSVFFAMRSESLKKDIDAAKEKYPDNPLQAEGYFYSLEGMSVDEIVAECAHYLSVDPEDKTEEGYMAALAERLNVKPVVSDKSHYYYYIGEPDFMSGDSIGSIGVRENMLSIELYVKDRSRAEALYKKLYDYCAPFNDIYWEGDVSKEGHEEFWDSMGYTKDRSGVYGFLTMWKKDFYCSFVIERYFNNPYKDINEE